jgi:hypothetical protein
MDVIAIAEEVLYEARNPCIEKKKSCGGAAM